jgi:predicted nicotinamide N-methyase
VVSDPTRHVLDTTGGEFPLHEYRLREAGHEWSILHTGAILDRVEESRVISQRTNRLPYGVALWPSGIALAHEIATRATAFSGRTVLELGAGAGLPGIVAASFGAHVVQTDREELVLHLCRTNGQRNGGVAIDYRLADWTDWRDEARYEWIIGSDILYGEALHPQLRRIFESNLAPRGRILISDPFRGMSLRLLESLEAAGWGVSYTRWDVGEDASTLPIAVFELEPPPIGRVSER